MKTLVIIFNEFYDREIKYLEITSEPDDYGNYIVTNEIYKQYEDLEPEYDEVLENGAGTYSQGTAHMSKPVPNSKWLK